MQVQFETRPMPIRLNLEKKKQIKSWLSCAHHTLHKNRMENEDDELRPFTTPINLDK